ncbi:hypothetical protein B0H14DRAFT_1612576 [Mycena olivaceomarginata]|nr:hypothetical protein B0H14DRAFT_1612576 [Mycena olivaceomarginata]
MTHTCRPLKLCENRLDARASPSHRARPFPLSEIPTRMVPRVQVRGKLPGSVDRRFNDCMIFPCKPSVLRCGTAKPSFLQSHLERMNESQGLEPQNYDDVKWAAAAMFGIDDLELSHRLRPRNAFAPGIPAKAQQEIDSVVGAEGRLPGFEDREELPLVECIMQETLRFVLRVFCRLRAAHEVVASRWHPPTELGVPHALMKDDVTRECSSPRGLPCLRTSRNVP